MLYALHPSLSAAPQDEAATFFENAREQLSLAQLCVLTTLDNVIDTEPAAGDGVVFFNPPRADGTDEIEALLTRASAAGAVILPIALREADRRPPGGAGDRQSFDVVDHSRRRELVADQRGVVARAFGREALSRLQPTYNKDRLRVFLCHRRADGEGLVALVDRKLSARHELVFRDLIDVQAGEQAQQRIDEALAGADVIAFFDTPLAGESWWIAHELAGALGHGIPVVWIRTGSDTDARPDLPVKPGPAPHVDCAEEGLDDQAAGDLADDILEQAFVLARAYVRTTQSALRAIKDWAASNDAQFETLDARRMIFELRRRPSDRPYPTRPATDVVQFFARHPSNEDYRALEAFLTEAEMGPHQRDCRAFDAAILLDPTTSAGRIVGEWSVVEHPERFLGTLTTPTGVRADRMTPPRLMLLGAFPSGALSHQEVTSAVHAAATTWLRLGGAIVFGGHPTFTPLITEAARLTVPGHELERVTVYQSRWFASPHALEDLATRATVVATDQAEDLEGSLTMMRTAMIQPDAASAVLAIGGRTTEGGLHIPGIDEEVRLARAAHLAVFLLGAPGGQASVIADTERRAARPWAGLGNPMSSEANERLMQTDDFEAAVRSIWNAVVQPPRDHV